MVLEGDTAPDFTAPLAHGDDEVGSFTLSERLDEAPLVLAFFPGAFTTTCSHEMNAFEARLGAFTAAGGSVYGVSVDSPFALGAFREQLGLSFGLVSDANREVVAAYDVATDWAKYGLEQVAKRAVFVVDRNREVTDAWVADDTKTEPDYDAVLAAVRAASR
jgi:peroxiredoxin